MIKTSKNITRWVCPSQILPLCLNHHVPTLLMWHINMWYFCSLCLSFNHPPMPLNTWHLLIPNNLIQVILFLDIRTWLSYVWYLLCHLPPWHPKVISVSCNNFIFNILYLPLWYQCPLYRGEGILVCDRLAANPLQKIGHCFSRKRILA